MGVKAGTRKAAATGRDTATLGFKVPTATAHHTLDARITPLRIDLRRVGIVVF